MRRGLAVLGTAATMAAGGIAGAPAAAAADWPATDGMIVTSDSGDNIYTVRPDGSGLEQPSTGRQVAWAADGSRYAYINHYDNQVYLNRWDSGDWRQLPVPDGTTADASYPTFWWSGGSVVFTRSGRLQEAPSDGSLYPSRLFPTDRDGCDKQPSGGVGGLLAFVRTGDSCATAGTPALWLYDGYKGTQVKLADNALYPSLSPDGSKIVFVRTVDGYRQLFSINVDGTGLTQLTSDASDHNHPSWSPAGDHIAYDDGTGTRVLTLATGESVTLPGATDPAWQPLRQNRTGRVWGADVYGTNIAASKWTWNTLGQSVPGLMNAKSAVLVGKDSPSYALTAAALGGKRHGPVLMTPTTSLSTAVKDELKRTLSPGSTVYLVGNTDILSSTVASSVSALGFTPKRLSGVSRYSTSVAVAKSLTSAPEYVFLATGTDYHSAIAASAAAGSLGTSGKGTVVLSKGKTLTSSVKSYLNSLDPDQTMIITVGSSAQYALTHTYFSNWPDRFSYYPISGRGHDGTAAMLAKFWWYAPSTAGLADVDSWRGGVSASTAMTGFGPVLWTGTDTLSAGPYWYLYDDSANFNSAIAFGGGSSVSAGALSTAGGALSAGSTEATYTAYYNGQATDTASTSSLTTRATELSWKTARLAPKPGPGLASLKTANDK